MIIIEFSRWNGFSIKRGILKGKHSEAPLKTVRLGFVAFTVLEHNTKKLLLEAMAGLSNDINWLIKNRPKFDRVLFEEKQKYIDRDENGLRQAVDSLNVRVSDLREENMRLATENHQLRSAIKVVG